MNLDKLLSLYQCLAKRQALTLQENYRTTACQWIQKLEAVPATEEKVKRVLLHALKLLLLSLERKQLVGPFEDTPEAKEFTDYNWHEIQLNDFVTMVNKKDLDRRGCPKFSHVVSGNRRELATYQNDPSTGQHCYYACSSEPIERWDNLEGGAIPNDSVETWRQHGEWDVLNDKGSDNASIDVLRCQPAEGVAAERCNANQSNYYCRGQDVTEKTKDRTQISSRLRTPKRLGGTTQDRQYYPEEFGLNRNEHFRSPRVVFENSEYDQYRTPQGESMPDRSNDSEKKATCVEGDKLKDNVRARLANIRNKMNQPAKVEVHQEIELEPDVVPYDRILLHEPSNEYEEYHLEDDVHSLSILSSDAMYDEDMFGAEQTVDPNTIFKNENVNLVSRSVVKLETNTTISGNERKVTEEFLEQEDVNFNQKRRPELLMNTSEPVFESPSAPIPAYDLTQHRPGRSPHRPRKIQVDGNWYQRNESAPQADHGQSAEHSELNGSSRRRQVLLERANQHLGHRMSKDSRCRQGGHLPQVDISERLTDICQPSFPESIGDSGGRLERNTDRQERRHLPQVNTSERLEDINQPEFPQSFEGSRNRSASSRRRTERSHLPQVDVSERIEDINQPDFPQSFDDSRQMSEGSRQRTDRTYFPQVEVSERLTDVGQPSFPTSYEESRKKSDQTGRRDLPQVDVSERLEDVYQPQFPESFQGSRHRSEGNRQRTNRSRLPQVDVSERLTDVRQPSFPMSYEESRKRSDQTGRRDLPQVDVSERLEDVYQPEFPESFQDSRHRSEGNRQRTNRSRLPQVDVSERLTDVGQPSFSTSYEESIKISDQTGHRDLPQVDVSERLEDAYQPEFPESFQDSRHRSEGNRQRTNRSRLPQVDVSEQLTDVGQPSFPMPYEESRKRSDQTGRRYLPQVDVSERLEDVYQPEFPESLHDSLHRSEGNRQRMDRSRLPQVDVSERLTDVGQPSFPTSYEESIKISDQTGHRDLPQVDVSERLEDVYQPEFPESYQDSRHRSEGNRQRTNRSRLPQVDVSERLTDICQPNFPESFDEYSSRLERSTSRKERSYEYLPQINTSERLEDINQPDFPQSFEDSRNRSGSRRRRTARSYLPQGDFSEQLIDVCQPSFPPSLEESRGTRTKHTKTFQQVDDISKQHQSQCLPEENLDNVSEPVFISDSQDFTYRSRNQIPLHSGNFKDVSHQAHPSPRQRLEASLQRGPPRIPFPKQNPNAAQSRITQRAGDYKEPFRSMANYAPFKQQINPECFLSSPRAFTTKLKLPGTFVKNVCRSGEIPLATSTSRIPPPTRRMLQQSRPSPISPTPSRSKSPCETYRLIPPRRIQMPHGTRPNTGIPRPEQSSKPSAQEHLIKKSTVKYFVKKSTFSKDQLNGPQRSARRKK